MIDPGPQPLGFVAILLDGTLVVRNQVAEFPPRLKYPTEVAWIIPVDIPVDGILDEPFEIFGRSKGHRGSSLPLGHATYRLIQFPDARRQYLCSDLRDGGTPLGGEIERPDELVAARVPPTHEVFQGVDEFPVAFGVIHCGPSSGRPPGPANCPRSNTPRRL